MTAKEIRSFVRANEMYDGEFDRHRMIIFGEIAAQIYELVLEFKQLNTKLNKLSSDECLDVTLRG